MSGRTPMMRQYQRIKKEHQDSILLFHLGDFYEMFFEDAKEASSILNIALTSRDRHKADSIPLCGIPCHAADSYISRLLQHGRKVAICDQVEDPAQAQGLVRREVTRVITPGTVLDDKLLEGKSNNFLAAVFPGNRTIGLSALDLSTGEFYLLEVANDQLRELEDRLFFFSPSEVLLPAGAVTDMESLVARAVPGTPAPTRLEAGAFDSHQARDALLEQFRVGTLDGFGCGGYTSGVTAAGSLLRYVQETQRRPLSNLVRLAPFLTGETVILDTATQKNLELVGNIEDGRREGSLLWVLDRTATPMGGRRLRSWVLAPLIEAERIDQRLAAVAELVEKSGFRRALHQILSGIYDLERLSSRISLNTSTPRDAAALRNSLRQLPALGDHLGQASAPLLSSLAGLDILDDLAARIEKCLVEEPPLRLKEGGIIRDGFHPELDELRRHSRDAKAWLNAFEQRERSRTGISSLKVGFNKIFGYYIEITKANLDHLPPDYSRRQTLVNAERFHSAELVEFEGRILGAEEKITELEGRLFEELRRELAAEAARIQKTAAVVADTDALHSLAEAAAEGRFSRPEVDKGLVLEVTDGRHPVVELAGEERFVPNSCRLDSAGEQIMILTGPNMAGKSTFLRQVALITLMAQMGSFVPAAAARIGIVDRIFTRIGATDKLARGQSTFMVEMIETANILHHATPRSLVILDEVGRGTSTFDGLSIAWAVVEYLHGSGETGPKTLFATHYHQLTELPLTLPRAKNYRIAVREWENRILFLRKIEAGGADKSYGIQVAQLAGLPAATLARAKEILHNLESGELNLEGLPRLAQSTPPDPSPAPQMDLFSSPDDKLVRRLRQLDLDTTTPLEALSLLVRWKEEVEKKE